MLHLILPGKTIINPRVTKINSSKMIITLVESTRIPSSENKMASTHSLRISPTKTSNIPNEVANLYSVDLDIVLSEIQT